MLKIFSFQVRAICSVVLLLSLLAAPLSVQAQEPAPLAPLVITENAEIVPDQYIVIYKAGNEAASAEATITSSITANGGQVKFMYGAALNGYSAYLPAQALAAVRADPAVESVTADAIIKLDDPQEPAAESVTQSGATWGLDRIDQRDLPLSTDYTYETRGVGVHAYVIDTGIRSTHREFSGRASKAYDAIGDGQKGNDCNGHGTHVAGTIGGNTYGVAKKVLIHAVRVLDCDGSGSYSEVIAGVNWVTAHHLSPAVANMSLGGPAYTPLDTALRSMIASGVILVVAAGNSDDNACRYSPARVSSAITVGATDNTDTRAYYSNWGSCLDIFAPGSSITSAWIGSNAATNTISGTSMASPHVAGVVALYLEVHPTLGANAVLNALVSNSSKNKIFNPAGSVNRLVYSLFPPIPSVVTPVGNTSDRTPAYKWSRVPGATQYTYQLLKAGVVVYTKTVPSSVCGTAGCSNTPSQVLPYAATYKWHVQAYVNGVWQPYSPYVAFKIAP